MDREPPSNEGWQPGWRGAEVDPEVQRERTDRIAKEHLRDIRAMLNEATAKMPEPEQRRPCDHEFALSPSMLHSLECTLCGRVVEHPKRRRALERRLRRQRDNRRMTG